MDSARPIAERIAGECSPDTGVTFTFAMGTKNAENTLEQPDGLDRQRGYHHRHHRSYGEGQHA